MRGGQADRRVASFDAKPSQNKRSRRIAAAFLSVIFAGE
jgi:hypothetical protein